MRLWRLRLQHVGYQGKVVVRSPCAKSPYVPPHPAESPSSSALLHTHPLLRPRNPAPY